MHSRKSKITSTILNTTTFEHPVERDKFCSLVKNTSHAHGSPTGGLNEEWTHIKKMLTESAKTVLGSKTWIHQENSEEMNKVLKRCNAFIEWQKDRTSKSKKDHFKYPKRKVQMDI